MTATPSTARSLTICVPLAPHPALAPNRIGHEHWRKRQQAAKELREAAYWACQDVVQGPDWTLGMWGMQPLSVHEHIVWPKGKQLKDPDSLSTYCKPALDGIVDAGIIGGDSAKYIASVTTSQAKGDDAQGRIEVMIREVTT